MLLENCKLSHCLNLVAYGNNTQLGCFYLTDQEYDIEKI